VKLKLDISRYVETSFAYELDGKDYNIILSRLQIDCFNVIVALAKKLIFIYGTQTRI
jgi:hypothetical protein